MWIIWRFNLVNFSIGTIRVAEFFYSSNAVALLSLTFGFLSMTIVTIATCIFKVKCRECVLGCFKITRDVEAENLELEIEGRNRKDVIPPSSV